MENDDIQDLLALGGAISRQINTSNNMMIEQGKSTIPRLDPRKLIEEARNDIGRNTNQPLPPLPIGQGVVIHDDVYPQINGLNVTPMAPLIPLDLALTDKMREAGVKASDLISSPSAPRQPMPVAARTASAPAPVAIVPVTDPNQGEFNFITKLGGPKYSSMQEYLDEKFTDIEVKLSKLNQKMDTIINKKKKV